MPARPAWIRSTSRKALLTVVPRLQPPRRRSTSHPAGPLAPTPQTIRPLAARPGAAGPADPPDLSFHRLGFTPRELPPTAFPYAKAEPIPREDPQPHDSAGVRVHRVGDTDFEHPVAQCGFGLYNIESYVLCEDDLYLARAKAQADRLIACATEHRGGWFLPYPFGFRLHGRRSEPMRPPWYSGMAQGKALSLFVRLAEVTGEARYREAAERVFAAFLLPGPAKGPWVTFVDEAGCVWLEEYPASRPDRTLNGHLFGAWGLWDYWRFSGDTAAAALWDGALSTACAYFSQLRNPGGISYYCLSHEVRSAKYHNVHVAQLRKLHQMSGDPLFADLAEQLVADFPWPAVRRPVTVAAGSHTGFAFDKRGRVTGQQSIRLTAPATLTADERTRISGRDGHWYRIAAGDLAGYHVREQADAVLMRGEYLAHSYDPPLPVTLPAGSPHTGLRFDSDGELSDRIDHVPVTDTPATVRRIATWNGVRHALVDSGELDGYWIPADGLAFAVGDRSLTPDRG